MNVLGVYELYLRLFGLHKLMNNVHTLKQYAAVGIQPMMYYVNDAIIIIILVQLVSNVIDPFK